MSPISETVKATGRCKAGCVDDLDAPCIASQNISERRKRKRAGVKLAGRIQPVDRKNGRFCEYIITTNASRHNLYFTTNNEHYQLGMRLRIAFPYYSPHDSVIASEDDGEVTRTERLPDNRVGVAVHLRGPAHTANSCAGTDWPFASRGAGGERRLASRHPISAAATVADSQAGMRLEARCSDLSLLGCYVDTLNAFHEGTLVHLELRGAAGVFEGVGRVNCCHVGMGMGIGFQNLTSEQTSVLAGWLSKDHGERLAVSSPPEIGNPAKTLNRTLAMNLIGQLLSKGILTKADLAELHPNFI